MIISGGENIYPEEIEQELNSIREVIESVVVGIADKEFGMRPAAFLRTRDDILPDQNMLSEKLAEVLPRFKIPRYFFSWPYKENQMFKPNRDKFARLAAKIISES